MALLINHSSVASYNFIQMEDNHHLVDHIADFQEEDVQKPRSV